jgi:site-specific DNA-methyltransferase (adenine-specific)
MEKKSQASINRKESREVSNVLSRDVGELNDILPHPKRKGYPAYDYIMVGKKYNIIYADPPWAYSDVHTWKKMSGGVAKHYKTMNTDEICKLKIKEISAEDCLLFIWATFPKLKEVFKVIEAWGFEYVTIGFTWVKLNKKNKKPFFGLGYYTKSNAEICLIAKKGKPSNLKISNCVSSIIISEKREHSRKPDEARERIVELLGDKPRIELFARQKAEGWDIWGNELKNSIDLTKLRRKRRHSSQP